MTRFDAVYTRLHANPLTTGCAFLASIKRGRATGSYTP